MRGEGKGGGGGRVPSPTMMASFVLRQYTIRGERLLLVEWKGGGGGGGGVQIAAKMTHSMRHTILGAGLPMVESYTWMGAGARG